MSSIKFVIKGEVRRIPYDSNTPLTFQALVSTLQDLVPTLREKTFTLTWLDDESDVVTVATDYELREAVDVMSQAGSVLKFTVVETPTVAIPVEPAVLTDPFKGIVHHHVSCDECNMSPIVGVRYKCAVRDDFDLCAKCEAKQKQPYPMLKIVDPNMAPTTLVYAFKDTPAEGASAGQARCPRYQQYQQQDRPHHRGGYGRRNCPFGQNSPYAHPNNGAGNAAANASTAPNGGPQHGYRSGGSAFCNNPWNRGNYDARQQKPAAPSEATNNANSKPPGTIERKAEEMMKELEKFNDKIVDWTCPPSKFINAVDELIFGPAGKREPDSAYKGEAAKKENAAEANQEAPSADPVANNNEADDELLAAAIQASILMGQEEEEARKSAVHVATIPAANGNLPKPALRFVKDVSFPDGTNVHAGALFRKTWRVRNDGKHQWPEGAVLVTAGGDLLTPEDLKEALPTVNPQEEVDISLQLAAPTAPGLYTAYFRAQTKEEQNFGHRLWASIIVAEPEEEDWDVVTEGLATKQDSASSALDEAPSTPEDIEVVVEDEEAAPDTERPEAEAAAESRESANAPMHDAEEVKAPSAQAQQQSFALLWRRELEILGDMGFVDVEAMTPLLQTHLGSPVSLTAGAPNPEGMQRVIIALLNK